MRRDFPSQLRWVFERKYAVDSLYAPLTLAWLLWRESDSSQHIDARLRDAARGWVWPLDIAVEGLTALDANGREDALRRLEATAMGTHLLHESVDPSAPRRFTRRWFSWADMLYVELVLAHAGYS